MSDVTPPEGTPQPPSEPTPPAGGYPAPPPPPPPPPADYGTPPPPPPPPPAYGGPPPGPADQPFSVGNAFSWGWAKFQQNVGPIIAAVAIYLAVVLVVEFLVYALVGGALVKTSSIEVDQTTGQITTTGGSGFFTVMFVYALVNLVFWVLFAFLQAAVIRGGLQIADGQRLQLGQMFNFDKFGTILVAALIVGIATSIGFYLCVLPGIVVVIFSAFYLFFIIDKGQGAWESIMSSVNLVRAKFGEVFLLLLGVLAAWVVGAIACGIGLLITAPVALLALTYGYRKLQGEPVAA